jgi:hypothetical protein
MGLNRTIIRQAHFASFLALQITQPYSRVADIADDYAPEAWVHGHLQRPCVSAAFQLGNNSGAGSRNHYGILTSLGPVAGLF